MGGRVLSQTTKPATALVGDLVEVADLPPAARDVPIARQTVGVRYAANQQDRSLTAGTLDARQTPQRY